MKTPLAEATSPFPYSPLTFTEARRRALHEADVVARIVCDDPRVLSSTVDGREAAQRFTDLRMSTDVRVGLPTPVRRAA